MKNFFPDLKDPACCRVVSAKIWVSHLSLSNHLKNHAPLRHKLPKLRRSTFKTDCPDLSSHLHSFFKFHGEVKGVDGTKDGPQHESKAWLQPKGVLAPKIWNPMEPFSSLHFSSYILATLVVGPLPLPTASFSSSSYSSSSSSRFLFLSTS